VKDLLIQVGTIGKGLALTLQLLAGSLFVGSILGVLGAIFKRTFWGSVILPPLISLLRGTPLVLQLALIYFCAPTMGVPLSVLGAGVIAFGLNSFAYVSEILRSGIESLPRGQMEAAQALYIPRYFMWRDIILPQVMRSVLPSMINEMITLLKETALISTIGGMDLMRMAQIIAAQEFTYFLPLCIAGGYYYGLVLLMEWGGRVLERKWRIC
jgi:polar amino acid transport system permease protein